MTADPSSQGEKIASRLARLRHNTLVSNLRDLKVQAQQLKPAIKLGRAGLTPEFLAAFEAAIQRAPLIKLRFEDFKDERKAIARELAEKTGSRLVQQVGHTAVFHRAPKTPGPAE